MSWSLANFALTPREIAMSDSARFALHRPELTRSLEAGEHHISELLKGSAREYRSNHVLIEANTDHPYVYRMVSGWACRIRALADGRDQCILIFLLGDLFAVKSMFVLRHPDSVRTLCRSVIECVDQRELHRLCVNDPDVANRCMWQVIEEERRLHNWVVGLGQGSAEERLAMLFMDFHGRLQSSNLIEPGALAFRMPLTQVQLADHVGITAIHVNRVLKVFRESGIATVRDGEVVIQSMEKLRELAYPLLDIYEKTAPQYGGGASVGQSPSV
jgi:CRP/FNR family transcriptional regulator, anaerobic regulatory protein